MSPTISIHHSVTLPDGSTLDLTLKPSPRSTAEVFHCQEFLVKVEEFVLHGTSAPPEPEPEPEPESEADPGNPYDRPCPTLVDPPPEGGDISAFERIVGTGWIPFEDKSSKAGIGCSYQELAELLPGESSVAWREESGHWVMLPLVHRKISQKTPRMVIGLQREGRGLSVMSLMIRNDGGTAVILKSKVEPALKHTSTESESPKTLPDHPPSTDRSPAHEMVNLRELVQKGLEQEDVGLDNLHSWVKGMVSEETMPSWYASNPERLTARIDRILLAQGVEPPRGEVGA